MAVKVGKYIGRGCTREVYEFGPKYVLKKALRQYSGHGYQYLDGKPTNEHNLIEAETWKAVSKLKVAKYLARVVAVEEDGDRLIMERASVTLGGAVRAGLVTERKATDIRYRIQKALNEAGFYRCDLHPENIARVGRSWKAIDYSF